jgi:dienelactone hydrolase
MRKRLVLIIAATVVLLIAVPVLIVQFMPDEIRTLGGVDLKELTYQEVTFPNSTEGINLSAIAYLKANHSDAVSDIGVMGMSQGGQIAPIVATQSKDLAFVINVVGSATPFNEALLYEENNNLRELGFLPGISNLIAYPSTFFLRNYTQKEFWDAVGDWDPLPYWREVSVPALVLYGDIDSNVPSQASADRLNALGKPKLQVVVFAGSGHALEDPLGIGDDIFRRDALDLIRDFIFETTSGSAG